MVQSECILSVVDALQIIRQWNPEWLPVNWMIDFSEVEINALETVIAGLARHTTVHCEQFRAGLN